MPESRLNVVRFVADLKSVWDTFIPQTKNGTFLFLRDYMDYHADRFPDYSLMFYKEKELVAVLPAHLLGDAFCTHNGLTYGGFLLSYQATIDLVMEMFHLLYLHLKELGGVKRIIYRTVPSIYHTYPSQEDLYVLFRMHAKLVERRISSVVKLDTPLPFRTLHCRKLKRARKEGLSVLTDSAFNFFWPVLEENLKERHSAHPVHSLEEIIRLHQFFPKEIELHRIVNIEGETLGGCLMYITNRVARVQYIGSTAHGRNIGVLDFLFDYLLRERYLGMSYFDFGTSVEAGGQYLNKGLIFQKEGFGGRAVVYDTYELELNSILDDKVF